MGAVMRVLVVLATTASGACLIAPPSLCDGAYDFDHSHVLGPEINDSIYTNAAPFLTRDRLELYFERDDGAIYWSHRDSPTATWAVAVKLPFNQQFDGNPFVTADGTTLYFTRSTIGLMKLTRTPSTGQFDGTPQQVDRPDNAGSMSMTDDQLDMYYEVSDTTRLTYHAHRPSTNLDFPAMGTVVAGFETLGPSPVGQTTSPGISADGRVMLVATIDQHLYRATGTGDAFVPDPIPLEANLAYDGSITDDTIMIYARNGTGIVTVERTCNN